jgi:Tfp pilus assembly protein PilX
MGRESGMVEARGVLIATVLAALLVIGLLGMAVQRYSPHAIQEQACKNGELPVSQCDR